MTENEREPDVADDGAVANSRDTGGVQDSRPEQGSTTSTTPDAEDVGRIAGDDIGYTEETGAERRGEAD